MKNIPFEQNASIRLPVKIQRQRLNRVIREELTEKQREILLAYYFQDMSITEIAKLRSVHKSTVCRTLHRAEDRLRRFLRY
jgi:RNA polymerase sigma factor (sigma-70 family)